MEEITEKMRQLQFVKDYELIDSLVEKMVKSSYISTITRSRVVNLLQNVNMKSPSSVTMRLMDILRQPSSNYIRRCDVREVISLLKGIQNQPSTKTTENGGENWVQEQWFCFLVDSYSNAIIQPLHTILNKLKVCRRSVSPLFSIILCGELDEEPFFQALRIEFKMDQKLCNMTDDIMKKLFKYSGGITIHGSLDCFQGMAGNCNENMD